MNKKFITVQDSYGVNTLINVDNICTIKEWGQGTAISTVDGKTLEVKDNLLMVISLLQG